MRGIGAELGIKDRILTIISPLEGSPSQKAGLRAGDKIIKIGDQISADISIDEAVDLIRGEKGTDIKLTVLHRNAEESEEITITRDTIVVKSVELEFLEGNIAHLENLTNLPMTLTKNSMLLKKKFQIEVLRA